MIKIRELFSRKNKTFDEIEESETTIFTDMTILKFKIKTIFIVLGFLTTLSLISLISTLYLLNEIINLLK